MKAKPELKMMEFSKQYASDTQNSFPEDLGSIKQWKVGLQHDTTWHNSNIQ